MSDGPARNHIPIEDDDWYQEEDGYFDEDLDYAIEPEFDDTFQDLVEMDCIGDLDLVDCFHP
jgi:hypothetical protein